MNFTLRDIGENLLELMYAVETGSITEEEAADTIDALNDAAKVKIDKIGEYYRQLTVKEEATREEIKRLQARLKRDANDKERLLRIIGNYLVLRGARKIEGTLFTASFRRNPPKVVFTDADKIPEAFKKIKTEVSIDKTAIKKEITAGRDVPGAELEQTERVVIG